MKPLVTANIEQLRPYRPGKPIEETEREYGVKNPAKLASNENPLGPSPHAVEAMRAAAADMHLYPDGGCYFLKQRIAELHAQHDVEPHNIIMGNGSNEIIEFIIRTFVAPDENIVTADPSFVVYRLASISHNREEISVPLTEDLRYDLDAVLGAINKKTKVVFLANPNNPTGRTFDVASFERFLARVRDDVVIGLDEAYAEYIDDASVPNGLLYAPARHRLVVMRTFSKIYGLAGLRLGYGITSRLMVDYMDRVRPPFNVNRMAQVAAIAAIDDEDHVRKTREITVQGRATLDQGFARLGLRSYPSQANFLLVDFGRDATPIYEALMYKGYITRPVDNYGLPKHLRVTVGTAEQNQGFLEALAQVLNDLGALT